MSKEISNTSGFQALRDEFEQRLNTLSMQGLLQHGLAAMTLAMQEKLAENDRRTGMPHSASLELIMRGVFSTLNSDGKVYNYHAVEKLTLGYTGLMLDFNNERREKLLLAFKEFEKVLKNR